MENYQEKPGCLTVSVHTAFIDYARKGLHCLITMHKQSLKTETGHQKDFLKSSRMGRDVTEREKLQVKMVNDNRHLLHVVDSIPCYEVDM